MDVVDEDSHSQAPTAGERGVGDESAPESQASQGEEEQGQSSEQRGEEGSQGHAQHDASVALDTQSVEAPGDEAQSEDEPEDHGTSPLVCLWWGRTTPGSSYAPAVDPCRRCVECGGANVPTGQGERSVRWWPRHNRCVCPSRGWQGLTQC